MVFRANHTVLNSASRRPVIERDDKITTYLLSGDGVGAKLCKHSNSTSLNARYEFQVFELSAKLQFLQVLKRITWAVKTACQMHIIIDLPKTTEETTPRESPEVNCGPQ